MMSDRPSHWSRFLQDLDDYAAVPQPLEAVGLGIVLGARARGAVR